jgi:hypothetical protein
VSILDFVRNVWHKYKNSSLNQSTKDNQMPNIYLWVGGHTGYTGIHSGFSATGGGTAGNRPYWRDQYGATSGAGDFSFGPYYWGNTMNWLKASTTLPTTQFGYFWSPTTTLPKEGDSVWFYGSLTAAAGSSGTSGIGATTIKTNSVSCLYGAMTGDGYTSAGMTAWLGGYTAGGGAHGDVTFFVDASFLPTRHPHGLTTGAIGYGAQSYGDFSAFSPLRIRANYFTFHNKRNDPLDGGANNLSALETTTKVAVENLSSTNAAPRQFNMRHPSASIPNDIGGHAFIKGNWGWVTQQNGSIFTKDCNYDGLVTNALWFVQGDVVEFLSGSNSFFEQWSVTPRTIKNGGYIYGQSHSGASIKVGQSSPSNSWNGVVTLGSFNDGTTPTISLLECGWEGGGTSSGKIELASCQITNIKGWNTNIKISPNASRYDYPIIRDGFIKSGSIDMGHPSDDAWQQTLLAQSGGDNGLRFDNTNVMIKGYKGMSIKSGYPESITG